MGQSRCWMKRKSWLGLSLSKRHVCTIGEHGCEVFCHRTEKAFEQSIRQFSSVAMAESACFFIWMLETWEVWYLIFSSLHCLFYAIFGLKHCGLFYPFFTLPTHIHCVRYFELPAGLHACL